MIEWLDICRAAAYSVFGADFDGVDPVRVKCQVFPDCRYGGIRSLVAPGGIDRAFPARRNAVIAALALEGTIRVMRRPLQLRHVNVPARDVLDGGIGRFLQGKGLAGVGHSFAVHDDRDLAFRRRDGDRMIRSRNLDWLAVHLVLPSTCRCVWEVMSFPLHWNTLWTYVRL